MSRILAIAERCPPTALKEYLWSFPGAPVRIRLDLCVVDGLQQHLHPTGNFSSEQGLLLGRVAGQKTEICDFIPLPDLEPPTKRSVAELIPASGEYSLVGYYRIQHEGILKLDDGDLALAGAVFAEPHQVFLVVQTSDSGPANATFFFWDDGRMCGDFPFLEFPFDASLLAAAEQQRIVTSQQKVLAIPAAAINLTAPSEGPQVLQRNRTLNGVFWILLVALVPAGALTAWKLFPGKSDPVSIPGLAVSSKQSFVRLQAQRQNGFLNLTWDRESAIIMGATSAVLSIQDGKVERKISLDSEQVRSGSVLYTPITDQVQIQITVSSPTATESVMVLFPKVKPSQVQTLGPVGSPSSGVTQTRTGNAPPLRPLAKPPASTPQFFPAAATAAIAAKPPVQNLRPDRSTSALSTQD